MKHPIWLAITLLLAIAPALAAQDTRPAPSREDPAHDELRGLRRRLVDASNKGDMDALLACLDRDVVVTWANGEVSTGPDAVRSYLKRMTKGPNRIVDRFETNPEADDLTHLYGDTGVAYGHSNDHFVLTDGRDFVLPARWSATVVKRDGQWRIASFHASANLFDNPILAIYRGMVVRAAIGAFLAGVILMGILMWLLARRRKPGV